eukprot:457594-Hanusia_phi.AAC.1
MRRVGEVREGEGEGEGEREGGRGSERGTKITLCRATMSFSGAMGGGLQQLVVRRRKARERDGPAVQDAAESSFDSDLTGGSVT